MAVDTQSLAQHPGVTVKAVLPVWIAEDGHQVSARRVVPFGARKEAAERGTDPHHVEKIPRHQFAPQPLRVHALADVKGARLRQGHLQ